MTQRQRDFLLDFGCLLALLWVWLVTAIAAGVWLGGVL